MKLNKCRRDSVSYVTQETYGHWQEDAISCDFAPGDTQAPESGEKSQEGGVLAQGAGQGEDQWGGLGGAGMGSAMGVVQDSPFQDGLDAEARTITAGTCADGSCWSPGRQPPLSCEAARDSPS